MSAIEGVNGKGLSLLQASFQSERLRIEAKGAFGFFLICFQARSLTAITVTPGAPPRHLPGPVMKTSAKQSSGWISMPPKEETASTISSASLSRTILPISLGGMDIHPDDC